MLIITAKELIRVDDHTRRAQVPSQDISVRLKLRLAIGIYNLYPC